MTNEELLTKYLETKDAKYFDAFDRRMRPRIYKLALKLLHSDESSADDITQDVLLKLMMLEPRTFDPPITDFVFAITRNLCKNFFRDEKSGIRRNMEPLDAILKNERAHGSDSDFEGPSMMKEEPIDMDGFNRMVETLPPDLKETVELRFTENMSLNQTAQALNLKRSGVKSRMNRAFAQIREDLGVANAT